MSHHPVIRATDLVFEYPDGTRALDGFSVEVHDGERVAVLGANGAGKTTFALHLNGLHRATSGDVAVDGLVLSDTTVGEIRRRVGHVFQDPDDQLFMPTVAEDVGFGPANLGVSGHELEHRIADALGKFRDRAVVFFGCECSHRGDDLRVLMQRLPTLRECALRILRLGGGEKLIGMIER